MTNTRIFQLRRCLKFVRDARAALAAKDVAKAFRYHAMAVKELYFVRGYSCLDGWDQVNSTAGLYRVLGNLGDAVEAAVRPRSEVPAYELVDQLFEGLQVLRSRGVDVEDDLLLDRARNLSMQLSGQFDIRERRPN